MQKRIILLVVVSILIVLLSVGFISYLSVRDSIRHSLDSHLTLASIIGKNIDYILERNITRLHDISISGMVDFDDNDWEQEKKALRVAYEYSIFTDGVFLLDMHGNIVLTYPHKEVGRLNLLGIPYVNQTIAEGRTVISDVYSLSPIQRKVIFVLVPLTNKDGETVGVAGGEINPANYMFTKILKTIPLAENTSIELLDSHGMIISSNEPERILTYSDHNKFLGNLIAQKKKTVMTCHRCHLEDREGATRESDMLAFAPLSIAPWGISVRDPQEVVFAPSTNLIRAIIAISLIYLVTTLLLAIGLSKSIVRPITLLIDAAKRIARGDLSEPIVVERSDEIGTLAHGFETMRTKLAVSLDRIRRYNVELEKRVHYRTEELLKRRKQLAALLDEVMKAQEDERRRIARELHDETSQSIAALGMSLEIAVSALKKDHLTPEMLFEQRKKAGSLLDGINRIIQDLRPTALDDLGFESAIRWLLERHLKDKGVNYRLDYCNSLNSLSTPILDKRTELGLFRVIQEAVINISKYADAKNVVISLACVDSNLKLDIIDDGVGFDVEEFLGVTDNEGHAGYGLLGIRERVEQLEGILNINSKPGEGTHITIINPVRRLREKNVTN
jgi:signal transduction histidine kinase